MAGELVIMAIVIVVASLILALPPVHKRLMLPILLAWREMFVEWPLRLITGRRKPDYARIRRLEIDCGLIDPPPSDSRAGLEAGFAALGSAARASSASIGAILLAEARNAEAARLRAVRGELGELAEALRGEKARAGEAAAAARFTSRLIGELERDIIASFGVPPHSLRRIILPPLPEDWP